MQQPAQPPASNPSDCCQSHKPTRRNFLVEGAAVVLGGLVAAVPLLAGLVAFFDPLRRRGNASDFVRVAPLDALPADGMPRRFTVYADCADAWNCFPQEPLGAIFLRRTAPNKVEALNNLCPHLGCPVDFNGQRKEFLCPCHNSLFTIDGAVVEPSPSPRSLDTLDVELRDNNGTKEVWVKFENFYTDTPEKIVKT